MAAPYIEAGPSRLARHPSTSTISIASNGVSPPLSPRRTHSATSTPSSRGATLPTFGRTKSSTQLAIQLPSPPGPGSGPHRRDLSMHPPQSPTGAPPYSARSAHHPSSAPFRRATSDEGRSRAFTEPAARAPPMEHSRSAGYARGAATAAARSGPNGFGEGSRLAQAQAQAASQEALMHRARLKMGSRDQEAMRRLRDTPGLLGLGIGGAAVGGSGGIGVGASAGLSRGWSGIGGTSGPPSPLRAVYAEDDADGAIVTGDSTGEGGGTMRDPLPVESPDGEREDEPGVKPPNSTQEVSSPPRSAPSATAKVDFTVAVIGHQGVGKTTIISRAVKAWGASEPVEITLINGHTVSSRLSNVLPGGKLKVARTVRFLEVGLAAMDVTGEAVSIWPEGVEGVTGVVLCYDATQAESLDRLPETLACLSRAGIPTVILACKSDPDATLAVDAAHGNSLGEPYNIGLIEVTTETSDGKSKIRNGIRWLLFKLEQRSRRSRSRSTASHQSQNSLSRLHPPLIIPSTDPTSAGKPSPLEILSPSAESDGASSGGERIMYARYRHGRSAALAPPSHHTPSTHTRSASEAESMTASEDHRSSSGSLQWIMSAPIAVIGGEEGRAELEREIMARSRAPSRQVHDPDSGRAQAVGAEANGEMLEEDSAQPAEDTEVQDEQDDTRAAVESSGMERMASDVTRIERDLASKAETIVLNEKNGIGDVIDPDIWLTMPDLYRKLFSAIVSTEDEQFVSDFFLTFRRFCTPLNLMIEFHGRFLDVEGAPISRRVQTWALLKMTGALIDWTSEYPGDLADDATQDIFREVLAILLRHVFLGKLTAELSTIEMDLVDVEDIDASWALKPAVQASDAKPNGHFSSPSSADITPETDVVYELEPSPKRETGTGTKSISLHPTKDSDSSTHSPTTSSVNVSINQDHQHPPAPPSLAHHRRQSNSEPRLFASGTTSSASLGSGCQDDEMGFGKWAHAWNTVMHGDPRSFAMDLTRMQWEKFAMIRPRDVFRHDMGKEQDDPVGQSIKFFNHLSRWVTTMILANPKPKHRARIYERFMLIAHHLRRLSNYDSLYAVISGMRETSVHRLTQTHALISPAAPGSKDFQSHLKLMDPRGGYMLYRRALEADISNGSPAIPLLTTILGMVNRLQTVRPEDIRPDGAIQWDKFAKFSQLVSCIYECQMKGAVVNGEASPDFVAMIEETPIILSEDGLFERSRLLEPPYPSAPVAGGKVLKRLANLGMGQ